MRYPSTFRPTLSLRAPPSQAEQYKLLASGILSDSAFEDIADAIRVQNGSQTQYRPGDMAAAILALSWDAGLKPRALLTSLETLEFNYVDGWHCYSGGVPVDAWEIDPAGYSSAAARHDCRRSPRSVGANFYSQSAQRAPSTVARCGIVRGFARGGLLRGEGFTTWPSRPRGAPERGGREGIRQ